MHDSEPVDQLEMVRSARVLPTPRSGIAKGPIRPIDCKIFIRNVNARPSIADEISRLEDGSSGSFSGKFRMAAAIRVFAVDCK